MACCLTAPSHYIKQCWLMVLWYSPKSNFIGIVEGINLGNKLENYTFKIIFPSARGQWVKESCASCRHWFHAASRTAACRTSVAPLVASRVNVSSLCYSRTTLLKSGIILCMRPAKERWRYIVTSPLIGWSHTQNDPCIRCYLCEQMNLPTHLGTTRLLASPSSLEHCLSNACNAICMLRNISYVNYHSPQKIQHSGCWWPCTDFAPVHLQPSWWWRHLGAAQE